MLQKIIYGPIHSRRLGASLGVNLLPYDGKICSFDCIYCECGYNEDNITKTKMPTLKDVIITLSKKLQDLNEHGTNFDAITFSGNGEPTLHPDFKTIINETCNLRDRFCKNVEINVLTNGTRLEKLEVIEGLLLADNAIIKLDSAFDSTAKLIDKPQQAYSVQTQVKLYKNFDGNFILQTMFLRGEIDGIPVDNTTELEVDAWIKIVKTLSPKCVMIYTIDRPTPCKTIKKIELEKLKNIEKHVQSLGIKTIVAS